MRTTVVGAGKMGLPIAVALARRGAVVTACDIDEARVDAINEKRSPVDEPGVAEALEDAVDRGLLEATVDLAAAVSRSDVVLIIVPVLLSPARRADLSILESVVSQIGGTLQRGALVIVETTVPVGTTRKRLLPLLEAGGFRAGTDFYLAYSPERVKSRHVLERLQETPKIVGGIDADSVARAKTFYERFLGTRVIDVDSLENAEFAKLAGMIYRDVTIALSNQLASYGAEGGLDVHRAIEAANTDGETFMLQPGIGVGGHCTPVYPYFLIQDAADRGRRVGLAEAARRTNEHQPRMMVEKADRLMGGLQGHRVLILGLGFRPDVKEAYCSPAFGLRDALEQRGAEVCLNDPLYETSELTAYGFEEGALDAPAQYDVVILNTGHAVYKNLVPESFRKLGARLVVDGRRFFDEAGIREAGLEYLAVDTPIGDSGADEGPEARVVPLTRPQLDYLEADRAADVICSGWVMQGPEVSEFEREMADYLGTEHVRMVSSGTAALHLALVALGIGSGDEVLTPTFSFIASANCVVYAGATPIFVDIEAKGYNVDPEAVERAITDRTKAVICVHQFGMPCDLKRLREICDAHDLYLVEDAACALGSEILLDRDWELLGRPHSDVACFSFHPRKVLTTGEGGFVATRDAGLADSIATLRNQGKSAVDRPPDDGAVTEEFPVIGYNYRMTDIQAAIGRQQLDRLADIVRRRRALADRYRDLLGALPDVDLPVEPTWARSNWQSHSVTMPSASLRADVVGSMQKAKIAAKPMSPCIHEERPYRRMYPELSLANSESRRATSLFLPLYPDMRQEEQNRVVATLERVLARSMKSTKD